MGNAAHRILIRDSLKRVSTFRLRQVGEIMQGTEVHESLSDIAEDLEMYRVFLEAAMEKTTIPASVARKALAHLGSQRMSVLKKKIYESEFGKQVVSATNNHIQVHAKDEVAIGKVTRASSILKDAQLPNRVLSGVQRACRTLASSTLAWWCT